MAERAHPDDPGFKHRWNIRMRRGLIPWISLNRYRHEFFWRYRWINKFCHDKAVLDIPCGMGWGTSLITSAKVTVGVDIAPDSISEAIARYGDCMSFKVGSMEKLDFATCSFDVVTCLEGIEHVTESTAQSFICEAARVLKPYGELFISSPHAVTGLHSGNPFHEREYSETELKALISPYFDVINAIVRRLDNVKIVYLRTQKKRCSDA